MSRGYRGNALYTADQETSADYIPSTEWVSSDSSALSFAFNPTGRGIFTNQITGNIEGTYEVTITAAQPGSEIFGTDKVPLILSVTFSVAVSQLPRPSLRALDGACNRKRL